jgi:hypothetical protein
MVNYCCIWSVFVVGRLLIIQSVQYCCSCTFCAWCLLRVLLTYCGLQLTVCYVVSDLLIVGPPAGPKTPVGSFTGQPVNHVVLSAIQTVLQSGLQVMIVKNWYAHACHCEEYEQGRTLSIESLMLELQITKYESNKLWCCPRLLQKDCKLNRMHASLRRKTYSCLADRMMSCEERWWHSRQLDRFHSRHSKFISTRAILMRVVRFSCLVVSVREF